MPWHYVPDETPKRKHYWDQPVAGFVEIGGEIVAKCPNNVTIDQCEELLNHGVPWSPVGWRKNYPKRIYIIHHSVVYRATVTVGGVSYHAFPELAERFPPGLREDLLARARMLNCENEVRKWLKP